MGKDASKSLLVAQRTWPPMPTPRPCSGLRSSGANRTEILNALKLWPTPTQDSATERTKPYAQGGTSMALAVMFASPAARDWRSGKGRQENGHTPQLCEQIGGQLNPEWVEWLMGFPAEWTALSASATRSSRKSSR
jgi:hypothetical protein